MIITTKFTWFHSGKTGGDHFSNLINKYYQEEIIFQHSIIDANKHIHLQEALDLHHDLMLNLDFAMNYRQFHSWLVSWNRHHFQHIYKRLDIERKIDLFDIVSHQTRNGNIFIPKVARMLLDKIISKNNSQYILHMISEIKNDNNWIKLKDNDDCLNRFLSLSEKKTTHIIRQEYLTEDFYNLTSKFFNPKKEILKDISTTNVNLTFPEISLSKNEIDKIYANNPRRYKLDLEIYGCIS